MRKVVGLVVLALILLPTPARANERQDKCRYQSVEKGRWTRDEVVWTIRCAAQKFGVDVSTALYVADRESNMEWWAQNPSGACGIYQHMPAYFESRLQAVPDHFRRWKDSCFNARSNILAALWMAHRDGWGAWGL